MEQKIEKKKFTILGIDIYWYALLITSAIAMGILIFKKKDRFIWN